MSITEAKPTDAGVQRAIKKMRSLRDGDFGVVEAVACGRQAVPALRELLFEREPSGIYQPRCWAARALAILGAHDVLFEFLRMAHEARDPVEREGDDAVVSAAARYLSALHDERVFQLLLRLANGRHRPGVIGALAAFHREEAIPYLVDALAEDDCRLIAESALLDFGVQARAAVLKAATTPSPSEESESETSIRAHASALGLLLEMGAPQEAWPSLRQLMLSRQPRIALLACELCLSIGPEAEWASAVRRLVELLKDADWRLESDIEECLVRHNAKVGKSISAILRNYAGDETVPLRSRELLLSVEARAARLRKRMR
jgi:hypothetical protein